MAERKRRRKNQHKEQKVTKSCAFLRYVLAAAWARTGDLVAAVPALTRCATQASLVLLLLLMLQLLLAGAAQPMGARLEGGGSGERGSSSRGSRAEHPPPPPGRCSQWTESRPGAMELEASLEQSVQTRIFKIIVIGDSNVGKTCLTLRFCGGAFPASTEATIGVDFREKAVEIEGEHIKVQVWDTAGQERFRKSMVEHYYRNVHAVVFVYDVTKMASFLNLKTWIEECNGHAVPALVPKVLVGNKCDLRDQIQVPSGMALKFADAHNMLLFETSAKDPKESQNVESIFMCLACRLKAQKSLLYRDMERQQGRRQKALLTPEASSKNTCPC